MKSMPMIKAMAIAAHEGRKTNTRRLGDHCKYNVGDICYVQEDYWQAGHWESVDGVMTKTGRQKIKFVPASDFIVYERPVRDWSRKAEDKHHNCWHKRLGRFMPEKYSRNKVEVVSVRRELLQDITEADAIAEGVVFDCPAQDEPAEAGGKLFHPARDAFKDLWESINGPDSWKANPSVWRIEFRRCPA